MDGIYIVGIIVVLSIFIGGIITFFKDGKINDEEKIRIKNKAIGLIKSAIKLSDVKDEDELKKFVLNEVMSELDDNEIKVFTKDELEILVNAFVDIALEKIEH